jgi:acetyl-CoA acetyltransferase
LAARAQEEIDAPPDNIRGEPVETMCVGGGQSMAMIIERLN